MHVDPQGANCISPRAPGRGPWLRLLSQVLQLAGPQAEFLTHAERPWTSATFEGTRHIVILAFRGRDAMERGEAFGSALPDHEFDIAGHLVADAAIASIERENGPSPQMRVEADFLLLRDC